jgi:hypothetical protein
MAITAKVLARGTLTDTNATIYTVPSATTAIVTNIVFCNITAAAETVTLEFDGVELVKDLQLSPKSTTTIDLRQVIDAADLIEGLASDNTAITYHISGVEVA